MRGVIVIGGTRRGKSSLLLRMIEQDINNGTAAIVLDPHGDLTNDILANIKDYPINVFAEAVWLAFGKLIWLLQIDNDNPFGLNIYECDDLSNSETVTNTVDNVISIFARVFSEKEYQPRIQTILRHTAIMVIFNGLTMADIPWIFASREFRDKLMEKVPNDQTKNFWIQYDRLRPWEKSVYLEGALNRLDQFLSSDIIYRIVSQRKTTIPLRTLFRTGGILLVSLPPRNRELANFLGSLFLAVLSQIAWEQSKLKKYERRRIHIYLDEYGRFCSSTSSSLLKEHTKLNVCTTIAHQTLSDLKDEENKQAELQAGNLILFQLTGDDADVLVKNLTVPPEEVKIDPRQFAITREPLKFLCDHEHENPAVAHMAEFWLRPIATRNTKIMKNKLTEHGLFPVHDKTSSNISGLITYFYNFPEDINESTQRLNMLLYNAMKNPPFWINSDNFNQQLLEIIHDFSSFINFFEIHRWSHELSSAILQWLKEDTLYTTSAIGYEMYASTVWQLGDNWRTIYNQNIRAAQPYLNKLVAILRSFVNDIRAGCVALAQDPIYIPTGAIDIEELGKREKSYQERKEMLAGKLANLPNYHAYVQTHDAQGVPQEGVVRLYPPEPPTEERVMDMEIIKRIREVGRRFTTKWEEIEKDIAERQAIAKQTMQTTPPIKQTLEEPDTYPLESRSQTFYPR